MAVDMCESTRGEWGGACPDCGQMLPAKPAPLSSWMAQQETGNRWSYGSRNEPDPDSIPRDALGRSLANKRRGRYDVTERQVEIARIVDKHGGNMSAAAKELGITEPTVFVSMRRYNRLPGRSAKEAERMAS